MRARGARRAAHLRLRDRRPADAPALPRLRGGRPGYSRRPAAAAARAPRVRRGDAVLPGDCLGEGLAALALAVTALALPATARAATIRGAARRGGVARQRAIGVHQREPREFE